MGLLPPVLRSTTAALLAAALAGPGCGFFEELKSEESAEGGDSDTDDEPEDAPDGDCEFPIDDRCGDQDTVHRCDPTTLQFEVVSCAELCGQFMNFACIGTGTGEHGCWCTEPGAQKVLSCTELEGCLKDCVADATGTCADRCFSRTNDATVRLFGALVYCAHDSCHETCIDAPEGCAACIDAAV